MRSLDRTRPKTPSPAPRLLESAVFPDLARAALLAAALLTALLSCPAAALADHPVLTVGVEALDYPPYGSHRDGDYEGFARDLLDSFAAEAGVHLVYVVLPVKRLYQEFLETRTLDFKFPDSPTWHPSRRKGVEVLYSVPLCEYTDGIMVRPERLGMGVEGIRTLGIIAGFQPWLLRPKMTPGRMTVSENASISGLLGKAIIGRVDAVYVNHEAALHLLDEMGMKGKLVLDPDLPHATGEYHLSTIRRPDVLRKFDEFMRTRADLVQAIKRRHGLSAP